MEIPYLVEARKDTGLFNSKIAIWLFLASEVMLFGGLFSSYVFLRIYADFPWPERTLPILPGLINTFVLIASSVAVVMAWASLKLRKKTAFNLWMAFTVTCAVVFMALKGIEYNSKFHHNAARLDDFTVVEGHVEPGDNDVVFEVTGFTVNSERFDKGYFESITSQLQDSEEGAFQLTFLPPDWSDDGQLTPNEVVVSGPRQAIDNWTGTEPGSGKHGYEMLEYLTEEGFVPYTEVAGSEPGSLDPSKFQFAVTTDFLSALRKDFRRARGKNSGMRADNHRKQWAEAHDQYPEKADWEILTETEIGVDEEALKGNILIANGTVDLFVVTNDAERNYAGKEAAKPKVAFAPYRPLFEKSSLRDSTVVRGELLNKESSMEMHVDALDFRHLAMRAEKADQDPMAVIDKSWILNEGDEHGYFRAIWDQHREHLEEHTAKLAEKGKEPTPREKYRVEKQEILYYFKAGAVAAHGHDGHGHDAGDHHGTGGAEAHSAKAPSEEDLTLTGLEKFGVKKNVPILGTQFYGTPALPDRHGQYPHLTIPRERVQHESLFGPAWNNYYGIYFLITGLHGLHVIGGAIVLGYFWLVGGRKMYRENPEWLANRVEVGGLFWHFVDLVWIFLFPILYLM